MLPPTRSRLPLALLGVATLVLGCGQGLFDRGRLPRDAGQTVDLESEPPMGSEAGIPVGPDAGTDTGSDTAADAEPDSGPDICADASPTDAGINPISRVVDENGAELFLDEARLTIGPGTFREPTLVTLCKILVIDHTGAYGPVFEISVPAPGLFRQVAKLTLQVPFIGANQAVLALGTLDPGLSLAAQQWVPVSDSTLSPDQTSVTGSVTGFGNANVLQYGAVVRCPPTVCPSGQACNAGACQQCPTGSVCK
jgi:hypothetical protein